MIFLELEHRVKFRELSDPRFRLEEVCGKMTTLFECSVAKDLPNISYSSVEGITRIARYGYTFPLDSREDAQKLLNSIMESVGEIFSSIKVVEVLFTEVGPE